MNYTAPIPSTRHKVVATVARVLLWLVLAGWLTFAVAWGALHSWIVPRIGEFRPRLEMEASQALGMPVRIGAIAAQSTGLIPSFELRDVALLDPQGREALRLPLVLVSLSPRSLWRRGFEQLYIEQPELDVRRAADGRIFVAGLDFSQQAGDGSDVADWFFSQTEFVIHGGTLRWTDELRGAQPLALSQVDLVVRNSLRRHQMRLDATPPPVWGRRFTLSGQFRQPLLTGRAGRWQDWEGQVFGDFSQVDVSELRRHADPGIEIAQGQGALRIWADMSHGQWVGATADLALAEVNVRLGPALEPLDLLSIGGRLSARRLAAGFEFSTQGLQFATREGLHWPGGNVFLSHTDAEGKLPAQGQFRADKLDLAALARIASSLPLGTTAHAELMASAPRGLVETVQANWEGPLDALSKLQAKGRASALELAARPGALLRGSQPPQQLPGRPGVRGLTLDFDLTQSGGRAQMVINNGALEFPGVFEEPVIRADQLSADLQWSATGEDLEFRLTNLKFANADAQGQGQVVWRTSDPKKSTGHSRLPGVLDLQATLAHANGARVYRYLPLTVARPAREYVRDAVLSGSASAVKLAIRGDLSDFPFADPKRGEFHIEGDVRDASFAYVPRGIQPREQTAWPALTQLSGLLVFDRNSMEVRSASGRLLGLPGLQLVRADARIPDLFHNATVQVAADLRGPLGEALSFVNGSPLSTMTGQALGRTTATGAADYRLRLSLPINTIDKSRVQGTVTLSGNDVQITPGTPMLAGARGAVTFSETGFYVPSAQVRMFGGDLRFEGGMRSPATDPPIAFRGQGQVSAEGLRQARDIGLASRLAQSASGSTTYTAALGFRRGQPELQVNTGLQGMALTLPQPLAKPADAVLAVRYDNSLLRESQQPGQKLQDQVTLEIGRIASVVYQRDVSGADPRVLRGAIGVGLSAGESSPLPDEGVTANAVLATLDVGEWERLLANAGGAALRPSLPVRNTGTGTPTAALNPLLGYLPTTMALRAGELIAEGQRLHQVVAGGSREGLVWRANVNARELNGYAEFRQSAGQGAGRLYARLARWSIPAGEASKVEAVLDEPPASIPALDIVVEDLELRGKKLGRVEVDAVNRGAGAVVREGGVREWRLNKLSIQLPEATLNATGNWQARATGERRQVAMNFRLDVADSGELLKRFGMAGVVRKGSGKLEGQVGWSGSPLALDYPTLNGQFNVNLESGQFLKADPGLAKLLGVLSLQSLPRRLTLDFRDVFSDGFSFDFVRGDVRIEQGLALTNNLQMKGVNAAVLMEGSADIAKETQDLKVVVIPEINAGTASLIATVINPAIGLGTFLAQLFLRRPLIQSNTQEFHVDGTWADPRVTKVERKAPGAQKVEGTP
jgi:uncharacterized protein (TIGR02099 family)